MSAVQHHVGVPAKRQILGVEVTALDQVEAVAAIAECIVSNRFTKVGFLNAHVANLAQADQNFRGVLEGFLVLPDGVGVDIASKALFGEKFPDNLNGTDFVPFLLRSLPNRIKVGLIGAARDNVEAAADRLKRIAPKHDYQVFGDGFFTSDMEPAILSKIASAQPDVLLVAMGVPRQELWIDKLDDTHATVVMGVGALFDFLSGAVPRAPQWMRTFRLEWLFRLILEPSRLWRRYILGNPLFLMHLLRQVLFQKRNKAHDAARQS